jgi:hypothetical protein
MDVIGYCSQSKNRPRLLDEVRRIIQLKHYSIRTEQAYVHWIRRFILFHRKRHPREMGPSEVEAFLSHLAVKDNVAASTQNQALNALVFLCLNRGQNTVLANISRNCVLTPVLWSPDSAW